MKIGDRIFVRGYIDEIRKDTVIVRNDGGYFGTIPSEVIQSEQGWIPCSERLPKDGRQVLVYARSVHFALAKYDELRNADGSYSMQWVTFDAWKPFYTIKDVIAWMPLQEPYQEGRE